MRKKELLKHIPEKMPEAMTAEIIKDGKEKVLMIIAPEAQVRTTAKHYGDTGFVHFTSKDRYLTYYPKSGTWSSESFDWIENNSYMWSTREDNDITQTVRDFGKEVGQQYAYSISSLESQIRWNYKEKLTKRSHQRTTAHIQSVTPALPRGFVQWAKGKKAVKLFQPSKEKGTIERMFVWDKGREGLTEICRAECNDYGDQWNRWCYGLHYYTYGKEQLFCLKKSESVINNLPKKYEVFDNFDSLDMTEAQRSCLRLMNGVVDPSYLLNRLYYTPELEYVIKGGFIRLAADLINLGQSAAKIKVLKKLSKKNKERLIKYNGGVYTLELLQEFPQISDENLKEFAKIKSYDKANQITRFLGVPNPLNLNHVMTLLRKTGGLKCDNIRMYSDYLDMAQARGADIHDEIIYRNKRWREFHDRYVEEANREKVKQKAKKFAGIQKDYKKNVALYAWEGKGFSILVPRNYLDIVDEGTRQHHCVGSSDTYMLRMAKRESFILFLRHSDKKEEPYYTLEVKPNGQIVQAYAAYDRKPDYDKVSKILQQWQRDITKRQKGAKACTK